MLLFSISQFVIPLSLLLLPLLPVSNPPRILLLLFQFPPSFITLSLLPASHPFRILLLSALPSLFLIPLSQSLSLLLLFLLLVSHPSRILLFLFQFTLSFILLPLSNCHPSLLNSPSLPLSLPCPFLSFFYPFPSFLILFLLISSSNPSFSHFPSPF